MKRDYKLFVKILRAIEASNYEDETLVDADALRHNFDLLFDLNLLKTRGRIDPNSDGGMIGFNFITNAGHDFLALTRDDDLFDKIPALLDMPYSALIDRLLWLNGGMAQA